ncbi:MAG TPA: glycosyltransferase family 39 protein [Solirubrobacteraceae bacterium]|nr:glycosyltransferase family 39 protein [Solirubrobacteraceae bacterium]
MPPDQVGLGEYLAGWGLAAAVLGAAAWVAVIVVRRRLPWLRGTPRALAFAVVMTSALLLIHLTPLMLGVLSRGTVLLAAALLAAAMAAVRPAEASPPEPAASPGAESRASWVLVAVGAAVAGGWFLVALRLQATQAIGQVDQLAVYLPDVARYVQRGSLWENDQFVPFLANGNYPQNGVLLQLAAVLPWRQDAFVRAVFLPFAVLTVIALYALARELGAPRTTSWLAGLAFLAMPHVAFLTVEGLPDTIAFFGLATGALFLLRHARTGSTAELVVGGAALGLAFGTKWYGAPAALVVVAAWALYRRAPRHGALVAGCVLAAGGVWLVRNLVLTSSPIFPAGVRPFGITIFDAPANEVLERVGFTVSDYLTDAGMWSDHLVPAWWDAWGPFVPLVLAGAVVAVAAGRRHPVVLLLGALVVALLAVYVVTPNSALGPEGAPTLVGPNARYGLPAVVFAAVLTAWAAGRWPRARVPVEAGLVASVVAGLAKAPLDLDTAQVAAVAAALLATAGIRSAARSAQVPRGRRVAVAAALIGAAVALVGGRLVQDRHEERRYATHDAVAAWIRQHAPDGHAVGIAGREVITYTSPIYPLFGPRLRNRVEYVGPFVDGLLRTYDDARGFAGALERGAFDLLVVYRLADPRAVAREERWAAAAGFAPVAQDARLTLLRRR